jgi:hypothetical protein
MTSCEQAFMKAGAEGVLPAAGTLRQFYVFFGRRFTMRQVRYAVDHLLKVGFLRHGGWVQRGRAWQKTYVWNGQVQLRLPLDCEDCD